MVLNPDICRQYVERFNRDDSETVIQQVPNVDAADWLVQNIPLFDCPDPDLQETYYFRWWVYRKHLNPTSDGTIITEFLPAVSWAGKHNSINCPAAHHIYEGRWLASGGAILRDYIRFWFRGEGKPRAYSVWLVDAVMRYADVTGDRDLPAELLPDFLANYEAWERSNLHASGLFWSDDDRDGMELSISGPGLRPTINAYMFADARAIAQIAQRAGRHDIAERFSNKAATLRSLIHERLWDDQAEFFKVIPLESPQHTVTSWDWEQIDPAHNVREQLGYVPWYFDLPEPGYEAAWRQLVDPAGFLAPFGPTTAEQRHPRYRFDHPHECLWNGPSWPFATSQTLTAMANVLRHYPQSPVTRQDYLALLRTYARSHHRTDADGKRICWIDENLDPHTGEWVCRQIRESKIPPDQKIGRERGKDYNHSTFCDLIIAGLIGIQPGPENVITIDPLVPPDTWAYFCLDGVHLRGYRITVLFDRDGTHYHQGVGFKVLVNGQTRAHTAQPQEVTVDLGEITTSR